MDDVKRELEKIVGPDYVSDAAEELFIYSRDQGTMEPSFPDLVAMPGTVEEIQDIVRLANRQNFPIVPLGGGLVLSGLSRPLKGGLVLDLKRLNRIIEVDELNRFALVEAGASQGMLQAYLKKHHPTLKHSIPDAPPIATLAGNMLIHGSGHLSHLAGFHTDMLGGLEVVLPTGEVTRSARRRCRPTGSAGRRCPIWPACSWAGPARPASSPSWRSSSSPSAGSATSRFL